MGRLAEAFMPETFQNGVPSQPFDGKTFEPAKDRVRLTGQYARVFGLMKDGEWRTLANIAAVTLASEAAISARLRDMRKPRFGGHTVLRQRVSAGLWRYRVVVNPKGPAA